MNDVERLARTPDRILLAADNLVRIAESMESIEAQTHGGALCQLEDSGLKPIHDQYKVLAIHWYRHSLNDAQVYYQSLKDRKAAEERMLNAMDGKRTYHKNQVGAIDAVKGIAIGRNESFGEDAPYVVTQVLYTLGFALRALVEQHPAVELP